MTHVKDIPRGPVVSSPPGGLLVSWKRASHRFAGARAVAAFGFLRGRRGGSHLHLTIAGNRTVRPGKIGGTQQRDPHVRDAEAEESGEYLRNEMARLRRVINDIGYLIESRTREVDAKQSQTFGATGGTLIVKEEYQSEIIETIVITGVPNTAITVQLGSASRIWSFNTGPQGLIWLHGLKIRLNEGDIRSLTSPVAGNFSMELMGRQNPTLRFRGQDE